jgi:hypothetical protein
MLVAAAGRSSLSRFNKTPRAISFLFFFNIIPKLRCRLASISYASNLQIEVVIQVIICVAYPPLISLLGFLFDFTR